MNLWRVWGICCCWSFFFPLWPTCHKVIPCRGCKSLNMINSHANKYNCVSSWMEDRLWKSLKLRHVVLWQIFFKCFLLLKLEILLINQLRQQMLSSWGAAPGFRSQMVDIRTCLIYQRASNVPRVLLFFPLALPVLRHFVIFLSNMDVVRPVTFPKHYWAGRELSPERGFCCLGAALFSIPFLSVPTAGVSKGALRKGRNKRHTMRIMLIFTFTVSLHS